LIAVGLPEESIEHAAEASTRLRHDSFALGSVLHTRAAALSRLGRTAESGEVEAEALDLARAHGEPRQLAMALHDRAWGFVLAKNGLTKSDLAQYGGAENGSARNDLTEDDPGRNDPTNDLAMNGLTDGLAKDGQIKDNLAKDGQVRHDPTGNGLD